ALLGGGRSVAGLDLGRRCPCIVLNAGRWRGGFGILPGRGGRSVAGGHLLGLGDRRRWGEGFLLRPRVEPGNIGRGLGRGERRAACRLGRAARLGRGGRLVGGNGG